MMPETVQVIIELAPLLVAVFAIVGGGIYRYYTADKATSDAVSKGGDNVLMVKVIQNTKDIDETKERIKIVEGALSDIKVRLGEGNEKMQAANDRLGNIEDELKKFNHRNGNS